MNASRFPARAALPARVHAFLLAAAWCAALAVAREAAAQSSSTTTTIPDPVVTTTLPDPGVTTTTLPGPGASTTTTTLPGPGASTTTTTITTTTTTTTTTTSSTMVTSSTLVFSGFLQVDVQVEGQGSWTFVDDKETGAVQVAISKPGVLDVRASASQDLREWGAGVALHATPPATAATFRNLSASELAFTVTVSTADFEAGIGPSLWYALALNGVATNRKGNVVDIADNFIDAFARPGDEWLGAADQGGQEEAGSFRAFDRGVFAPVEADAVHFVWTFSLGAGDSIEIGAGDELKLEVGNQARQCVTKMNGAARKVGVDALKADAGCLKDAGDATSCIDDPADDHTQKSIAKALERYASACPVLPAWGVNSAKCCVGGSAAGQACTEQGACDGGTCSAGGCTATVAAVEANGLAHDLLGAAIAVPEGRHDRACLVAAARAAGDVWATRWQSFLDCKGDRFASISDDASLMAACLAPQPDSGGRIAKAEGKAATLVQKKCIDATHVSDLAILLPGDCSAAGKGGLASCLVRVGRCRFCRAVNVADGIVPAVDCELFDDATANGTCPAGP